MRRTFLVLASLVAACEETPETIELPPSLDPAACGRAVPIAGFVTRQGAALMNDGQPFRAVGANLYYLQQMWAYGARPGGEPFAAQARDALDAAVCLGLTAVRAVGFNDGDDEASAIRRRPGVFDEAGLRALDRTVAEAKARGLRLILPLTNNWPAYGGLAAYATWEGKDPTTASEDFFGDPKAMGFWKAYVSLLLARVNTITGIAYRDEPAILAWEIGNELRCRGCRGTTRYVDTIAELARHLRLQGPRQLIGDGGEGHDDDPGLYAGLSNAYTVRGDEGASFSKLAAVPELDLVSYHFYPGAGKTGLDAGDDARLWIRRHEEIARAAGKVAYLGEFGHDLPPERDEERAAVFHHWLGDVDRAAGALAILWQLVPLSRIGAQEREYAVVFDRDRRSLGVLTFWAAR
jgi:mannan endo-1,4-beta-mannosidase